MKPVSGRDFARIVERRGWTLLRINGSHHIYSKPGERKILSIPVHGSKNLKPGLANRSPKSFPEIRGVGACEVAHNTQLANPGALG